MEIRLDITRLQFYIITILIILLPISMKYRLLLFGERAIGEAVKYGGIISRSSESVDYSYTIIAFSAGDTDFEIKGPEDVIYELGEKVKVIYDKKNPEKCMIASLVYIYTTPKSLVSFVLLLTWIAFYTSFKPSRIKNQKK